MYFSGKEKRDSGSWLKTSGMRDSREKGAGMQDQDPSFQTLVIAYSWWKKLLHKFFSWTLNRLLFLRMRLFQVDAYF